MEGVFLRDCLVLYVERVIVMNVTTSLESPVKFKRKGIMTIFMNFFFRGNTFMKYYYFYSHCLINYYRHRLLVCVCVDNEKLG